MEKSKLSQLVTEILSYAKERYGSIATPDAATVVCAAATLLSSDGSYNTTDEDDQKFQSTRPRGTRHPIAKHLIDWQKNA